MVKVMCCGMAVVDFMFMVDEMPQLAEKYRATDTAIVGGGGAANAAVGIARLGGEAHLAGRLGDDQIGDLIVQDLLAEQVNCDLLTRYDGARSSYSSVLVDRAGERQIVNFRGDGFGDTPVWPAMSFDAALADTRWAEGAAELMDRAKALGVPGVMDAEAPCRGAIPESASHVAFSTQGLRDFVGQDDRDAGLLAAAEELDAWVCVTDGANGIFYAKNGRVINIPSFAVEVVDTLGAGDIWHAAFALRLGEGAHESEAALFANAAAALKCREFGGRTATPNRAEVEKFLREESNETDTR